MAKKETLHEEDIIDLTELIESGDSGDRRTGHGQAKSAPAATADADFEAMLNDAAPPDHEVDPDEVLDMSGMGGIDNLLDSLDMPPQPAPGRKKAADPAGVDDAIDDLLGNEPGARQKQAAAADSAPKSQNDADLDDLLGDLDAPSAPDDEPADHLDALLDDLDSPAPKKEAAPDLDDLFDGIDEPVKAPASGAAVKVAPPKQDAAAQDMSELDADLDDILSSFDEPVLDPEPAATPVTPKAQAGMDEQKEAEPSDQHGQATEAAAVEELVAESDSVTGITPEADFDALQEEIAHPEEITGPEPVAGQAPPVEAYEPEPAEELSPAEEVHEPEPVDEQATLDMEPAVSSASAEALAADLDSMFDETGIKDSEAQAESEEAPKSAAPVAAVLPAQLPAFTPESIIALCRNFAGQDGQTQQALQGFSRDLGEQAAHVEDIGQQVTMLGKRLLGCESKLAAARARVAALEKAMESTAAIEDLLRQGSPLHSGFMALISAAVSNALQGFALPDRDDGLAARIRQLEEKTAAQAVRINQLESEMNGQAAGDDELAKIVALADNLDIRMKALEERLAAISDSAQIEKAAAAAVARILHEEIERLAQS